MILAVFRKILAPGEEENLELEEELDAGTGAGSTPSFPSRVPGDSLHGARRSVFVIMIRAYI